MRKHSILIIDDTPMVLRALGDILKNDHNILIAKSGEHGFLTAKKNRPSLILLDIMMPGMSGFETMEVLQADEQTKNIPVIFVSGDVAAETKEKGYRLGAIDFIEKPFIEIAIKRRINLIIEYIDLKNQAALSIEPDEEVQPHPFVAGCNEMNPEGE